MSIEIVTLPCLDDNYAYLLHDPQSKKTALVDAPDAAPILEALFAREWGLDTILLTHHHADHIAGALTLKERFGAQILGAEADAHRLPPLDRSVRAGQTLNVLDRSCEVIEVSGHTIGHISFYFLCSSAVFTADSLMVLGCGRLFEGDAEMMWKSLSRLAALPADTQVYSGHEYTQSNAKFALSIDPDNQALQTRYSEICALRGKGQPTVPSTIAQECATNPFLRVENRAIRAKLGLQDASDVEVFAEIRHRKDQF